MKKPNGDLRVCQNFIAQNAIADREHIDIPNIRDVVNSTMGMNWFTVIDLKDAFYSIELKEEHKC